MPEISIIVPVYNVEKFAAEDKKYTWQICLKKVQHMGKRKHL